MNDTFDWPQWAALDVPWQDVIDYFQSMVVLGDPLGDALPGDGSSTDPVNPTDPADDPELPSDPEPDPTIGDGSEILDAALVVDNDWGSGATVLLEITNTGSSSFTGGWTVGFDLDPALIGGSWNSDWSADSDGSGIVVSDVGWNGDIGAGQAIQVGFQLNQGGLDEGLLNQEADFIFI
jgi:endoglucanase